MTTAVGLITPEKIIKFFHISQKQMEEFQKGLSIWGNILDCGSSKEWPEIWYSNGLLHTVLLVGTQWEQVSPCLPWGAWKHGEEWCQDRWALGVLGWTGKMAAWVGGFLRRLRGWLVSGALGPTSLPQWLLESPSTGREWHIHFPMHAPSNYWKLTPVYTDISGSAIASPMPLQDKLLIPCINELILLRELPTS